MKQLILTLALYATCQLCFAQTGTIKGHIHDVNENVGTPFARVILLDLNKGVVTDVNGDFIITEVPEGTYTLKVNAIGFQDKILDSMVVSADKVLELYIDYPPPCEFDTKDKTCPICNKKDETIPIVYGYPGKKLTKDAKKGKVILGGCVISGCDPRWYCKRDKKEF